MAHPSALPGSGRTGAIRTRESGSAPSPSSPCRLMSWLAKSTIACLPFLSPQANHWLSTEPDPHDLLITYPSEPMTMWPISTRVNKPENDEPSLLDRVCDPSDVWAQVTYETA